MSRKELVDSLDRPPALATEKLALKYVTLVYNGVDKLDAYKEVFPDRYKRLHDKAIADRRNPKSTLMYNINDYEQGKYVKSLYSIGAENYYVRFISKKTTLLDKLYDIALDDNEEMKHRLVASKTFLSSIPEPSTTVTHKVEVDVKDEFAKKLERRQKELYSIANETDILDAEVE